jgi:hypothetical protein
MLQDVVAISRAVCVHRPIPFIERMLAYWLSYQRFGVATMVMLLASAKLCKPVEDTAKERFRPAQRGIWREHDIGRRAMCRCPLLGLLAGGKEVGEWTVEAHPPLAMPWGQAGGETDRRGAGLLTTARKSTHATVHSGIHQSAIIVVNGDFIHFTYSLPGHRHPGRLNQPPSVRIEEICKQY